ncbi:MAG TPA: hypothetical protein VGN61_08690 [Verrucomicrobiae bacterium]
MNRIALVIWTTAALIAGATSAPAAPFNPNEIATDSAMLLHVDCDAIRASAIGQWLLSEPAVQDKLATLGAPYDVDLPKQLHGVTFYTTAAHSRDGVMVIDADFDPDHLLAKAQALNDILADTNGSRVIYSWVDEKWKRRLGKSARLYGAISGHHLLYGQSEPRIADAMDVLEGTKPSADAGKNPLYTKPGQRILLEAMIDKVDFPHAQGPAAIIKMCKSIYLKVSEADNTTTATLHLETADADTATQLNTLFQGFVGMLKMRATDTNAAQFANSIKITQDPLALGVTTSIPSSDLIEMIKSGQQKAAQKKSTHRAPAKDSQPNNN